MDDSMVSLLSRNESLLLYAIIFQVRPLGFEVSPSRDGRSAIITQIHQSTHRKNGLRIGSIISEINDQYVEDMKGRQIMKILNSSALPLKILFKQELFDITIHSQYPIGFLFDADTNGKNAIITNVYDLILKKMGLTIGCYIYKIGSNMYCDGLNYKHILNIITQQQIPFTITFRRFNIDLTAIDNVCDVDLDDNESKLQSLGGSMKKFSSLNTVFESWKTLIHKQNKQSMINQCMRRNADIYESGSVERIVFILSYYNKWINDNERYGMKMSDFFNALHNYDMIQLLNDYKYILDNYSDNISAHKLFLYLSYCIGTNIGGNKECVMFARNNRNRKYFELKTYFLDSFDCQEIVIQQHLDKMYSYLMCCSVFNYNYNYDTYAYETDEKYENENWGKLRLYKKEVNNIHSGIKHRKYETNVELFNNNNSNNNIINGYEFGYKYHYWNYYKSFDEDWNYFVQSSFGDLKSEILNLSISINEWQIVYNKAVSLSLIIYCKQELFARKGFVKDYEIEPDSLLGINHLMALLFYANFDFLCAQLKNTYLRQNELETYQQLKQRHSNYANLSKLLIECVHVWGQEITKKQQYMHCVANQQLLFAVFSAQFHSPTSVTHKLSVLYSAIEEQNDDGIILILGSDFGSRCFDISWISDQSHEAERIFCGSQYLQIGSIINLKTNENYQFYISAIKIFQTLLDGEYILHKISNSIISILINLINNEIDCDIYNENNNKYNIPSYVHKLFNNYCKNVVQEITIRMCYLSAKYISPSLRKYFIAKNDNMLKLDILFDLFPSIQRLRVTYEQNHGIILNQASYEYILNVLDNESKKDSFKFNELLIRPNDRKSNRIDPMISKYQTRFNQYGVNIKKETNVFGDDYVCFEKINQNNPSYSYCIIL